MKSSSFIENKDGCIVLNVRVIPRAANDAIQGVTGHALKVRITAPPLDGKANDHLIRFLSRQWKVPRAGLEIISGRTGRNKRLKISNPPDGLRTALLAMDSG